MSSSNHRIKLLDLRRREPPGGHLLCRANGGRYMCGRSIEYEASFMYMLKGRMRSRHRFLCPMHAYAFARKHGLLLPVMPRIHHTEEDMKYRLRHKNGKVETGFSLRTVIAEVQRRYSLGFAKAKEGTRFPIEDLEIDDIVACPVEIYEDWPDDDTKPDTVIEQELEDTVVDGPREE